MKIYPSSHNVVTSEEVTVNHIPLGYFTEAVRNINPLIKINQDFCRTSSTKLIYPYQNFNTNNITLFDKNNKPVDNNIYLKRNGNQWYFEPVDSTEFIPTEFTYSFLIARNDSFKNNIQYKLNIACYTPELAEQLIGMVNGESEIKPKNIHVNDDSLIPESLLNMNIADADFLFMDYNDLDDPNTYLNNHTNLWLFSDNFGENVMAEDETIEEYVLSAPQIYSSSSYDLDVKVKFNINTEISKFPKSEYEYYSLFNAYIPILVIKKENGGFVICSHSSLKEHTDTCYQLIYEVLMAVYLNSYFESNARISYITDDKITYYMNINKKYNNYHPRINITDILLTDNYNTQINYDIVNVILDNDAIIYIGHDSYNNALFKKTERTDPEIKNNQVSFYTPNNTIVIYDPNLNSVSIREDNLSIVYENINDTNYINIDMFYSSAENIINDKQLIEVQDTSSYNLCYDHTLNQFYLVRSSVYNEDYGTIYATIQFTYDEEISCGDIRTVGGGEEFSISNYDMIDTGSLSGRPYRIGSTMIIKLPARFRLHKDVIEQEIKKHMASADYPIILFEE